MANHCERVEDIVHCEEGTEENPDQVKFIKTSSSTNDPIIEIDFSNLELVAKEGEKSKFRVKNSG